MPDDFNKNLRLIWMIISIAVLLQLGWLLIELHFTKQSLAKEYQNLVGIKLERIQNEGTQNYWKFLQARLDQLKR